MMFEILNVSDDDIIMNNSSNAMDAERRESVDSTNSFPGSIGNSTLISLIGEYEYYYDAYDVQVFDEDVFEEIADYEDSLPYSDCENNQYCVGTYMNINNELILTMRIHISTFYKYSQEVLVPYMFYSSEIPMNQGRLSVRTQILQVIILSDDTYTVVVKTFWLRIVQRTWRRIFKQRKIYILCLKKLKIRETTQSPLYDKCMTALGGYPGLRGMLVSYHRDYGKDNTVIQNFV